jgi:hypothetical protein
MEYSRTSIAQVLGSIPLRLFMSCPLAGEMFKILLLSLLSFGALNTPNAAAADLQRNQLVELKSNEGILFFRMRLDYIGKTQDPAHFRKIEGDTSNADFYTRTYENLGRADIEFVQTVTSLASGGNVTTLTPNGPTFGRQAVLEHSTKPRFGKDGNKIAEGKTIRQHNVFVSLGKSPDSLIQKTTVRYQGVEYTFDDVLVFSPQAK